MDARNLQAYVDQQALKQSQRDAVQELLNASFSAERMAERLEATAGNNLDAKQRALRLREEAQIKNAVAQQLAREWNKGRR